VCREALRKRGINPDFVVGHSVGEFDKGALSPHAQKAYAALQDREQPPAEKEQGPQRPVE